MAGQAKGKANMVRIRAHESERRAGSNALSFRMRLTRATKLAGFMARDARLDGRFLTGVLTTGIYCLASCPARKPRPENVRFFDTEADAKAAGFRSCRRCRPDHFLRDHDPDVERMTRLVAAVRAEPFRFSGTADLARAAGVGASKLNALFRGYHHTTPAAFLARARIAYACAALERNGRRSLHVAYDSGFESASAFHENFLRVTALRPTEYRALGTAPAFVLRLPADYRPEYTLRVLGRDPDSPVERVAGRTITRVLRGGDGAPFVLRIRLERARARCELDAAKTRSPDDVRAAYHIALRMLGLQQDPSAFEQRVAKSRRLRPLVNGRAGLRVPLTVDAFEALTWSIVGQQVNLPFAYRLRRTLIELAGAQASDGLRAHPTAAAVAALDYADLTGRQFSRRKAEYVIDTARAIVSGELRVQRVEEETVPALEARLLAVRGLGPWSAQYVLLRGYGFADCVPAGDSGLATALERFFDLGQRPDAVATRRLMEPFAPHRSLATFHLWMSLGATP
jgi:AraC family transcriptional regulator of adaptative response / DNA-3-methyladenine glycosylase II